MDVVGLVVAIFGAIVVIRMLVLGAASADGLGFRHDEQPVVYWLIVVIAVAIDAAFFYIGLR
jgi:hypothetical protein